MSKQKFVSAGNWLKQGRAQLKRGELEAGASLGNLGRGCKAKFSDKRV